MGEPNETQDVNTSEEKVETSNKEPETFTTKDMEEATRKAKSDSAAEIGRLTKSHATLLKSSQVIQDRLEKKIKEDDEAEQEANRDKPEALTAIKERTARRKVESELAQVTQELDTEKSKTVEAQEAEAKHTKERNAREVASRLGVDAKTLIKFTDGSTEAMEELAKSLNSKGTAKTLVTDSGKTIGGGEKTEEQKLEDRYPTMK